MNDLKTGLFLVLFLFSLGTSAQKTEVIKWNDEKLVWADFKGKADKKASVSAMSFVGISYSFASLNKKVTEVEVFASFDKQKSWTKSDAIELLAHEQLHFDIVEVYVRKIRKFAQEAFDRNQRSQQYITKQITKLQSEYKKTQTKYDSETKHGIVKDKQKKWQVDVEKQLNELRSYQNPIVKLAN